MNLFGAVPTLAQFLSSQVGSPLFSTRSQVQANDASSRQSTQTPPPSFGDQVPSPFHSTLPPSTSSALSAPWKQVPIMVVSSGLSVPNDVNSADPLSKSISPEWSSVLVSHGTPVG